MVCYVCLPSEQPRKKLSLSAPPERRCLPARPPARPPACPDPLQMFSCFSPASFDFVFYFGFVFLRVRPRQTDRQTHRQTNAQTDRRMDGLQRESVRHLQTEQDKQTGREQTGSSDRGAGGHSAGLEQPCPTVAAVCGLKGAVV